MCVPGGTYLVTRTTSERRFFLRPDPVVAEVFTYCLFRAAGVHGVDVHAVCVEASHFHLVATDTRGELSEFMRWLDRHVALCLMEHYRSAHPGQNLEGIWSKQPFSAALLLTEAAIVEAIVYTLTNPVKDGLVRDYRNWPGVVSRPGDWLKPERYARRPELYFDQDDDEHREVTARLSIPAQFRDRDPDAFVRDVETRIRETQQAAAVTLAHAGRSFMGEKAVCRQDPFASPTSTRPKGGLNPRVAAGGDREALKQGILALRDFRDRYREAWHRFRRGLKAIFPGGTYLLRRLYGVRCHPLDAPWCCRAPAPG
jgi:REP element-mobilizing transposase RayT